jgi:hypothetical protein
MVNVLTAQRTSDETLRNLQPAVVNDYVMRGLKEGSPWKDLVALDGYRPRGRRPYRVRVTLNPEVDKLCRQRVDQIKKLKSRETRLRGGQIRKRLVGLALAKSVASSYDVPIDQLISLGFPSPLVLELISRQPQSRAGDEPMPPHNDDKSNAHLQPQGEQRYVEVTVLSDEEGQRLHDVSVARLKPDRILGDEEVKQRLFAARERNQRILARLEP